MNTLTLVGAHNLRPEWNELRRLEAEDLHPRASYFNSELNTELMDERYLMRAPAYRRTLYGRMPIWMAQVSEAYCVRHRYDAVISWNEKVGIPFAGLLKARGAPMPHVAIFSWISKPKTSRMLRATHSHFDRIILMSSHQRAHAINELGIPESKLPLLRWPVDTQFWRPLPAITPMMISAVGREMRDYETLIAAVAGCTIPLHIAANVVQGKNDPWIKTINEAQHKYPNITAGRKNFCELRELYARSRFLVMPVLPTDTDNGSTSILEAMAMGKAVICSRTEGQIDIIEHGKTGLFVPTKDPRAMREAIDYLWNNPDVAERMGCEAYAYAMAHHRLEDWVSHIKGYVEDAIGIHTHHDTKSAES
ncbi:MAG TPA: glycosyltransferase family 4 protein [Bacteroidota bacterium]|nr:glycosyltransferase family 4 protein [Bacteroidota bacterium]